MTVPPARIEGAMRAWNGIPDKSPVDFDAFRNDVPLGRPSRVVQRRAADKVIAQVEHKLSKRSYYELLERYGYGTLVVGLPLWFAVPADDPWRPANALDDFITRTALGLREIKRRVLRRQDCPFSQVVVIWDTTPQAWREWRKSRSMEYEDVANTSLENPIGASSLAELSEVLEEAVSTTGTPESEAPPMGLHVSVKTRKKASGKGPYPTIVTALGERLRKRDQNPLRPRVLLDSKFAALICKLNCFVTVHGVGGLERWVTRKFSVPHAWRARTVRRRGSAVLPRKQTKTTMKDRSYWSIGLPWGTALLVTGRQGANSGACRGARRR